MALGGTHRQDRCGLRQAPRPIRTCRKLYFLNHAHEFSPVVNRTPNQLVNILRVVLKLYPLQSRNHNIKTRYVFGQRDRINSAKM